MGRLFEPVRGASVPASQPVTTARRALEATAQTRMVTRPRPATGEPRPVGRNTADLAPVAGSRHDREALEGQFPCGTWVAHQFENGLFRGSTNDHQLSTNRGKMASDLRLWDAS
jgi:hypothetical protein